MFLFFIAHHELYCGFEVFEVYCKCLSLSVSPRAIAKTIELGSDSNKRKRIQRSITLMAVLLISEGSTFCYLREHTHTHTLCLYAG